MCSEAALANVPIDGSPTDLLLATRFRATVRVIAEQADRSKDYPPWLREIEVLYDADSGRAQANVLQGYDKGKTFLRRYDEKREYMYKGGNYPACERASLREPMPVPALPETAILQGDEMVGDRLCHHWVNEQFNEVVHIYVDQATRLPVKLEVLWAEADNQLVKMMTYEFLNATTDPIPESEFTLPEPWAHDKCTRNQAGFPYLHLFHHYLRF